jgi:hypothetical protein
LNSYKTGHSWLHLLRPERPEAEATISMLSRAMIRSNRH